MRKVADTSNRKRINSSVSDKVPLFQDTLCDIDKSTEPISKDIFESVEYNHPIRALQETAVNKSRNLQSDIAVTELENMISSLDVKIEHDQKYNKKRLTKRLKKQRAELANKLKCRLHDKQNRESNLEKMRTYHEQNKMERLEQFQEYYEQNRESKLEKMREYHEQNKIERLEQFQEHYEQNKNE